MSSSDSSCDEELSSIMSDKCNIGKKTNNSSARRFDASRMLSSKNDGLKSFVPASGSQFDYPAPTPRMSLNSNRLYERSPGNDVSSKPLKKRMIGSGPPSRFQPASSSSKGASTSQFGGSSSVSLIKFLYNNLINLLFS